MSDDLFDRVGKVLNEMETKTHGVTHFNVLAEEDLKRAASPLLDALTARGHTTMVIEEGSDKGLYLSVYSYDYIIDPFSIQDKTQLQIILQIQPDVLCCFDNVTRRENSIRVNEISLSWLAAGTHIVMVVKDIA